MTQSGQFMIRFSARAARRLSVLVIAGLVIGYIGGAALPEVRELTWLRLVGLCAAVLLFLDVRGQMVQSNDRLLDERERMLRDSAYRATHQVMVAILFISFLYLMFARKLGWWLPGVEDAVDMLSAFTIGSTAMPGIILAWRERPELADEEDA